MDSVESVEDVTAKFYSSMIRTVENLLSKGCLKRSDAKDFAMIFLGGRNLSKICEI